MTILHDEMTTFRALVTAALGDRIRFKRDDEGWPYAMARYGRLEWRGREADGSARLYAYTSARRLVRPLRAIPGCHPAQIGQGEAAFWVRGDDGPAIQAVAATLRMRVRRLVAPARAEHLRRPVGASTATKQAPPVTAPTDSSSGHQERPEAR